MLYSTCTLPFYIGLVRCKMLIQLYTIQPCSFWALDIYSTVRPQFTRYTYVTVVQYTVCTARFMLYSAAGTISNNAMRSTFLDEQKNFKNILEKKHFSLFFGALFPLRSAFVSKSLKNDSSERLSFYIGYKKNQEFHYNFKM
jgi:hypothetical protein